MSEGALLMRGLKEMENVKWKMENGASTRSATSTHGRWKFLDFIIGIILAPSFLFYAFLKLKQGFYRHSHKGVIPHV